MTQPAQEVDVDRYVNALTREFAGQVAQLSRDKVAAEVVRDQALEVIASLREERDVLGKRLELAKREPGSVPKPEEVGDPDD